MAPTVFVCGATGTQGGALVRALLPSGVTIHALARDPTSPKAKALEQLGVHLHPGHFGDEAALRTAIIPGTDAIFLNFMPDFVDFGSDLRYAKLIMSIAKDVGVRHVVHSGGLGTDAVEELVGPGADKSLVAVILRLKADIEEAVAQAGFDTYTLLRPGNFMANYIDPFVRFQLRGLAETGASTGSLDPEANLPMVSTRTIGAFSAAAILNPERFNGKVVPYADELLTLNQIIEKLRAVTGKNLKFSRLTDEEIEAQRLTNPFIGGGLVVGKIAKFIDFDEVKSWGVPLEAFDEYLARERQTVQDTYGHLPSI